MTLYHIVIVIVIVLPVVCLCVLRGCVSCPPLYSNCSSESSQLLSLVCVVYTAVCRSCWPKDTHTTTPTYRSLNDQMQSPHTDSIHCYTSLTLHQVSKQLLPQQHHDLYGTFRIHQYPTTTTTTLLHILATPHAPTDTRYVATVSYCFISPLSRIIPER